MEKIELLNGKVRKYDEEKDKDMFTVSYSKLDLSQQCPFRYNLHYNQDERAEQVSIALDLGSVAHKILELKADMLINKKDVDYSYLKKILYEGITETTDKGVEVIIGLDNIKKKFGFETCLEKDNTSGMNYEQKIEKFLNEVVPIRFEDEKGWKPFAAEKRFDFVYNYGTDLEVKEVHIKGFIDIVLEKHNKENKRSFKVKDYKTSKKTYEHSKTATSLQQFIYGLALYTEYGVLPEEYEYDFIFLNQKQKANTNGYLQRGLKKLDKILNKIDEMDKNKEYRPNPSPLCYFCDYCSNNPNAKYPYNQMCQYYSLWTSQNKTFEVNKKWGEETDKKENKRKLIF